MRVRRRELQRPLRWYKSDGALTRNERLAREPCRLITHENQRRIHDRWLFMTLIGYILTTISCVFLLAVVSRQFEIGT
jgi:predicted nucleic acid-binding Zn ribbon protein